MQTTTQPWSSEDNLWKSVVSFHHVRPKGPIQGVRLGHRHLYWVSHLACSSIPYVYMFLVHKIFSQIRCN